MRKSLPVLALLFLACCLLMPLPVLAGSSGISGCAWIDSGSGLYEGGGEHTREEWLRIDSLKAGLKLALTLVSSHFA